jgi:ribose-phosphate pyrophosphokinase
MSDGESPKSRPLIFHCESMEKLAMDVVRLTGGEPGEIHWDKFTDGWPNIFIEDVFHGNVRGREVIFFASFDGPSTIFEQFAVMYALPQYRAKSLQVILPFYPVGTMERVVKEGEIATAKSLARMFDAIPLSQEGRVVLTTFDLHTLQGRFYFDIAIPDLVSAIPLLLNRIEGMEDIAIAFPDDGAYKRFGGMFLDYPIIICNKVRRGNQRIVTIREGDPRGKHVVIVDDLILSGETVRECRNALIIAGAEKVSASCTNGVFPGESWKKFTPDLYEYVWITDSCPLTVRAVEGIKPFEVLSLASLIAKLI